MASKYMSYQEFCAEAALSRYASGDDMVFIESLATSIEHGGYGWNEDHVVRCLETYEKTIQHLVDNMQAIVIEGLRRFLNGE